MFFPSFFNLVKIQRVKSSSLCAENSTIFPLFFDRFVHLRTLVHFLFHKNKMCRRCHLREIFSKILTGTFKKSASSINITLRSAKKGSVSARSITSFGLIFFPSNVVNSCCHPALPLHFSICLYTAFLNMLPFHTAGRSV